MTENDLDRLATALAHSLRKGGTDQPANRHSDERRDVNVERSGVWMDYKTLIGSVFAMGLAVWWGSGQFAQIQYEMREFRALLTSIPKQVETTITVMQTAISERISRIEADRAIDIADRYSRANHELWCLETEKINRDIGWDCAPLAATKTGRAGTAPVGYYDQAWTTETMKDGKP